MHTAQIQWPHALHPCIVKFSESFFFFIEMQNFILCIKYVYIYKTHDLEFESKNIFLCVIPIKKHVLYILYVPKSMTDAYIWRDIIFSRHFLNNSRGLLLMMIYYASSIWRWWCYVGTWQGCLFHLNVNIAFSGMSMRSVF